ncbi:sodium:proton antiporter [Thalassobaculum fulvum]|uniref:Sodium:proton antiporter n=1 Tax=Thalassobaculum fulvum TaxID=1633335 RepID=A0A918XVX9_9PROT|nr:sodium:proton antiporter [Thalassobaculum fulvum]GHD57101.1 sodium:proton antiporter [Thalassobaculum fulvum]
MLTPFHVAAILVVLTAAFAALNHHLLRLPASIGLLVVALAASLATMGIDALVPGLGIAGMIRSQVEAIDFDATLMDGMLGFLLFAGALHVDLGDLKAQRWVVAVMASVGVVLSTALVGLGYAWLAGVPIAVALVFGALISPTDPVAVLGILKVVTVPKSLEVKIAGESLFNDGVAVVVFLVLVAIAFPAGGGHGEAMTAGGVALLFLQEAVGGVLFGGVLGWLTYQVLKRTDEYVLEILLTLALVMGGYGLAHALHVSGPLAMVVAGLFIGNHGVAFGMSPKSARHVLDFWHLVDEVMNAVLFLLIGVEVFAIPFGERALLPALAAVPLVLAVRFLAVLLPVSVMRLRREFTRGAVAVMTWGGLRGGISVALALSLPDSEWKPTILTATYVVVVFSIVVQGLTVGPLIRRVVR